MKAQAQTLQQAALPHVLAVDDDPVIRAADRRLPPAKTSCASPPSPTGKRCASVLAEEVVDLVVLDLQLQSEDGMAARAPAARRVDDPDHHAHRPHDEADRVMGLELGADDYLTKPFSPRELLARIRTVLRRRRVEVRQGRPEGVRAYRFDGWELNLNTRRLDCAPTGARSRSATASSACSSSSSAPRSASSRATSCSICRACTTTRSTTARSTCRSCGCAARSSRIRAQPRYVVTERRAGYMFGVPVETVY